MPQQGTRYAPVGLLLPLQLHMQPSDALVALLDLPLEPLQLRFDLVAKARRHARLVIAWYGTV